jgi:hypothetical protein
MSTITSLSVSSTGVIKFRWEGTGESLTSTDPTQSKVVGAGAVAVDGKQAPLDLTGWTPSPPMVQVPGNNPTVEVILTPPAPPAQPSIMFQTGLFVMITFSLTTTVGGPQQTFPATATVDAPYGQVVNAIAGPGGIKQDLDFVTGFPLQVYDSSGMPSGGGGGGGATAAPSARATVDAQMKAVLGRSTGTGGVTGTLAALDRSFQPAVSAGVDTWVWQPQSYVVQSDIGAGVTGEQASLARLAASVGDEILPLISGLQPLVPEAKVNPDEINAAKSIVASSWPGFVSELGTDGGPRITRAARLVRDAATSLVTLGILLATYAKGTKLKNIYPSPAGAGGVKRSATRFDWSNPGPPQSGWPAPSRANVVTGDDEANYTNFVIASDRMQMVIGRFVSLYYIGGQVPSGEDRGFLVTLLQRVLDTTGEAADAVYAALDSVNLGPDERSVIFVPGTDPSASSTTPPYAGTLSVEDILSWAASFPAEEASPLLQDAGNVGIKSIRKRAKVIRTAVEALQTFAPSGPPGLAHPRVTYALKILWGALNDVSSYAGNKSLRYARPTAP